MNNVTDLRAELERLKADPDLNAEIRRVKELMLRLEDCLDRVSDQLDTVAKRLRALGI